MHITNLNLHALETSFDLVAPRGEELIDDFCSRLFARAPAVRPLFASTDLQRQKAMLVGAVQTLTASPSRPRPRPRERTTRLRPTVSCGVERQRHR